MRIYYECGNCKYRWKGRKIIDHSPRCPKCNSTDIRLLGGKIKV